jgi:hypothetical protein
MFLEITFVENVDLRELCVCALPHAVLCRVDKCFTIFP